MTIKTAVALATGAAVGFLFGMGVEDKTKEKIVSCVKRKIYYALIGEEMPKKKPNYRPTTYASYCRKPKPVDEESWRTIMTFGSHEEAEKYLKKIRKFVERENKISIYDAGINRGMYLDYSWDRYGWYDCEVEWWEIKHDKTTGMYVIDAGNPSVLDE